jgi:hypothetical protein
MLGDLAVYRGCTAPGGLSKFLYRTWLLSVSAALALGVQKH